MPSRLALERRFVLDASTQLGFRSAAVPGGLLVATDVILLFVEPASWAVPCRTAVDDHSRARPALLLHGWAFAERPGLAGLVSGHALLALLVMFDCVFFALYLVRISQMRLAFCKKRDHVDCG